MKKTNAHFVDPYGTAMVHLANADPDMERLIEYIGPCGLKHEVEREPYEALIRAIAHQQLHGRAAEAITGRFLAHYPDVSFPTARQIIATEEGVMRACGFSAAKVAVIASTLQCRSCSHCTTARCPWAAARSGVAPR